MMSLIITAILFVIPSLIGCATSTKNWADLPALQVNECARTDREVSRNTLSTDFDSYISVIGYRTASVTAKKHEKELLSVYFIVIFHLINDRRGIIDAQSILVTLRTSGSDRVRSWIMSDTDGDGLVDRARYAEVNDDTRDTPSVLEMDAQSDIMPNLQLYFEKARGLMYSMSGPDDGKCADSRSTHF